MNPPPYTIGVTGGSGSGKTHFLKTLSSRLPSDALCLVSQDHYYKPLSSQVIDDNGVENFDLPTAIERERFHQDILKLKRGETVSIPEYTFNNPSSSPAVIEFKPSPILVVEGLFIQYFPEIDKELDLRIFIEAKDHLKLSRRIKRDYEERGYDLEDVLYRYQYHVMPVYESMIEPLKHHADLIIPNNRPFERALDLIVRALRSRLDRLGN